MEATEDSSINHWRRATFACARCHRRKVRCNVAASGPPCTNCRLDGHDCAVRPESAVRATRYLNEQPYIHVSRRAKIQLQCKEDAHASHSPPSTEIQCHADIPMDNWDPESALTNFVGSPAKADSIKNVDGLEDGSVQNVLVPFCVYPYLRATCLHRLDQADVAFLQSQNSLMIPMKPFLNILVSHYFLYVHPLFPILDEEEFWSIYRRKRGSDGYISLLVFHAMMFVACSYIPSAEAKKYGGRSILDLRNSFYRRAKLLFDFGVEDDPLVLAQAAALLTHQSTETDYSSNSTWLAVAIQHARTARSHLYDSELTETPYKRSDLKRLWWSLAIRDRTLAVGMRRPLQIPPAVFDFAARQPLVYQDLSGETTTSSVYGPATKTILFKMLTNLCLLVVAVTNLVQMVYPADAAVQHQKEIVSHLSAMAEVRNDLNFWKARAIQLSPRDLETHKSIPFYDRLVYLYYETARLALYHHTPPWFHHSPAQQSQSELIDTITAINDMMQKFSENNTVEQLPLSVLSHTALPQMVVNFGRQLALDAEDHSEEEKTLKTYEELNSQCKLRFGISHISIWAAKSFQLLSASPASSPTRPDREAWFSATPSSQSLDHPHLLYSHPKLYYQLANIIDTSLASGKSDLETNPLLMTYPMGISRRLEFVADLHPAAVTTINPYQPFLPSSATSPAPKVSPYSRSDYEMGQAVTMTTEKPIYRGNFWPEQFVNGIAGAHQFAGTMDEPFTVEDVVHEELEPSYDAKMMNATAAGLIWDHIGLFGA